MVHFGFPVRDVLVVVGHAGIAHRDYTGRMNATIRKLLLPFSVGVLIGAMATWLWLTTLQDIYIPRRANGKARIPYETISNGHIVLGHLGPLGEMMTIHGTIHHQKNNRDEACLEVETVNGQPRSGMVIVSGISGIHEWAEGTEATMSGYEVGTIGPSWNGMPPQSISLRFCVYKVVEPKDLAFELKRIPPIPR